MGLHFLYTGTDASLSIRQGHWLRIPRNAQSQAGRNVHVLKWNAETEHLDLLAEDSLEAQSTVRGLQRLNRGLVDYTALRQASVKAQNEQGDSASRDHNGDEDEATGTDADGDHNHEDPWTGLTSHITPRLLNRILSQSVDQDKPQKSSAHATPTSTWTLTSVSTSPLDTEKIPGLSQDETDSVLNPTQTLHLLPIDLKKTWDETDLGSTRTERARDRSWYLQHLISMLQAGPGPSMQAPSQQLAAKDLLAEVQFTFLMVLCLANYSCLEQWKRLLSVLFTCQTALTEVEGFFTEAVSILRTQLSRIEDVEGGLFEMGDEVGSAWLRRLLRSFREYVDEAAGAEKLRVALKGLEEWLRERYGWADEKNMVRRGMVQLEDGEFVELQDDEVDEDEETGEYAPVVVEM